MVSSSEGPPEHVMTSKASLILTEARKPCLERVLEGFQRAVQRHLQGWGPGLSSFTEALLGLDTCLVDTARPGLSKSDAHMDL